MNHTAAYLVILFIVFLGLTSALGKYLCNKWEKERKQKELGNKS